MPPGVGKDGEGKCKDRVKLLLRIAKRQDQQMVNAKFELSLVTYLTTVKRYAVLYVSIFEEGKERFWGFWCVLSFK